MALVAYIKRKRDLSCTLVLFCHRRPSTLLGCSMGPSPGAEQMLAHAL